MNRRLLITSAVALAVGLGALFWYSGTTETETGRDPDPRGVDQGDPQRTRPDQPFRFSRPTTDQDVPPDREAALARPETPRNKAMAQIRRDFAAGRHSAVIQKSRAILKSDPDLDSARVFLAMSACAVGDEDVARRELSELPGERREFVAKRCAQFGLELGELR